MGQLLAGEGVRWLAAAGRVLAAADLHLQMLEAGAEIGLEEEVQHVAAIRFGIIEQQPRRRPGTHGPKAFKGPSRVGALQVHGHRPGGTQG